MKHESQRVDQNPFSAPELNHARQPSAVFESSRPAHRRSSGAPVSASAWASAVRKSPLGRDAGRAGPLPLDCCARQRAHGGVVTLDGGAGRVPAASGGTAEVPAAEHGARCCVAPHSARVPHTFEPPTVLFSGQPLARAAQPASTRACGRGGSLPRPRCQPRCTRSCCGASAERRLAPADTHPPHEQYGMLAALDSCSTETTARVPTLRGATSYTRLHACCAGARSHASDTCTP